MNEFGDSSWVTHGRVGTEVLREVSGHPSCPLPTSTSSRPNSPTVSDLGDLPEGARSYVGWVCRDRGTGTPSSVVPDLQVSRGWDDGPRRVVVGFRKGNGGSSDPGRVRRPRECGILRKPSRSGTEGPGGVRLCEPGTWRDPELGSIHFT